MGYPCTSLDWLHQLLIGQSAIFHTLINTTKKLDNWGIAANIACYHKYNDKLAEVNACIEWLQAEVDSICLTKLLCKGQLEAARVLKQLAHMECLAPVFMWCSYDEEPQVTIQGGWKCAAHGCA